MNKTFNINLAGLIFHIDENAYQRLERYLEAIKRQFNHTEGGHEIISDIEARVSELFKQRTSSSKEVINLKDVEEVIEIMGKPEDFVDPEDPGAMPPPPEAEYASRNRRIYRDPDNRIIGGVSSGLAAYFNIDALWLRLLFVILFFAGPGVIIYIIMWVVIPKASTTAEKLKMRGEHVNVSNIERSIREEMRGVEDSARRFSRRAQEYDYSKPANHVGRFFSDLGNFLADTFRLIFRFLFKLIGLFFLIIGFIILFAVIVSLFAGTVQIMDSSYGIQHFFEFMKLVTAGLGHYNLLMAAIILTVIAPLFLLIYFGIRILFDLDPLNRPTRAALSFTTFIGLVLLIIAGVRIGIQYDQQSYVTRDIGLGENGNFYLTATSDSLTESYDENYSTHWLQLSDNAHAFNLVEFDVRKAEGSKAYLEILIESHGFDRREARKHAEAINYEIEMMDSVIVAPVYYRLESNEKFRGQEVSVRLYLPEGASVYIDHSLAEYLYDVDNIQNMWDWEMAGKRWIMTAAGLSCEDCEIPASEIPDTTDQNDDEEIDLKINKDGIRLDYKSKEDTGHIQISSMDKQEEETGDSLPVFTSRYPIFI